MNRRNLLIATSSTLLTTSLAGCSGGSPETQSESPDQTNDSDMGGNESTESKSYVSEYSVEDTELQIALTSGSASEITELRVMTPGDELEQKVSSGITRYNINILNKRAGKWEIKAVSNDKVLESITFEPSFDISVENVGTLAQLDITGREPASEHASIQFTIVNTGDLPVSPGGRNDTPGASFNISIPSLNVDMSKKARYDDIVVDGEDNIISSGEERTYRYESEGYSQDHFLIYSQSELESKIGEEFQGALNITYPTDANREATVVPLSVTLGNNMVEVNAAAYYAQGTTITKRE